MRNLLPLALAGCSAALAAAPPYGSSDQPDVAELRARGPAALDELLARYDVAPTPELAAEIDAVAAQRYATVSRLYWYTDLGEAEAAAHARHVPILSLRMLGDLRDDLSCANSRLFRATLYANADVSAFLRSHFVLHWSSERPVPVVTIDFGDGVHRLVRTTTGNSAHYVLDEDGHVLDVLPGLYTPAAFRAQLTDSLALASKVRGASDAARLAQVVEFHQQRVAGAQAGWASLAGKLLPPTLHRLANAADVDSVLALAQRAAMSKARVEMPDLRRLGSDPGSIPDGDVTAWATAGQILLSIGDVARTEMNAYGFRRKPAANDPPRPQLFDARSRALMERLASVPERPLTRAQLDAMTARLEQSAVADTAQNQLVLRPQISQHVIENPQASFAELNAWIYATVFHTPKDDAWLGLLTDTDFSGLPGDGVATDDAAASR